MTPPSQWIMWNKGRGVSAVFERRVDAEDFADTLRRRWPRSTFAVLRTRQIIGNTHARAEGETREWSS
jgi:hypothetical protein